MNEMRRPEDTVRRVVIAGGGNIGYRWPQRWKAPTRSRSSNAIADHARIISERLHKAIVLHGDAADEELLLEENIDSADVFVSLTNAEEANILSAMLAKRLGCSKVMALINRPSYAELVERAAIDVAISPQQITIGSLLAYVRQAGMVRVHSLRRGRAEAIEAIARGDRSESRVVGRRIEEIALPQGATHQCDRAGQRGAGGASRHDRSDRRPPDSFRHGPPADPSRSNGCSGPEPEAAAQPADHSMHFQVVQRILGLLLMLYSITMMPPMAVSVHFADGQTTPFSIRFAITFVVGLLTWLPARNDRRELRLRDGFVVAAIFWLGLGSFGSLPLLLTHFPEMSLTDAVFEAVSGLTTTGATVLTGLDSLPRSILYYRAQLHWLGGMGIIVLAVAILPMLGVGGMQLYRAETPGPMKDSKLTPRITETAKALWLHLCRSDRQSAAWPTGMPAWTPFDAICHSFATVATGGFSTHDASIGYFNSPQIELIAVVFMFLAGVNFSLHFVSWRSRSLLSYWSDPEFRAYTLLLCGLTLAGTVYLIFTQQYASAGDSARYALFHFVSFMTSTGFVASNFDQWPGALPLSLILVSFIGGCAGSTGGGMKVVRWLLLFNQGSREVQRLVHPAAEIPIRLGRSVVPPRVIEAVWGFCVVYIILFGAMLLVLVGTGLDQITAFSALASSINNMGPGLGLIVADFTQISARRQVGLHPRHAARPARGIHAAGAVLTLVLALLNRSYAYRWQATAPAPSSPIAFSTGLHRPALGHRARTTGMEGAAGRRVAR